MRKHLARSLVLVIAALGCGGVSTTTDGGGGAGGAHATGSAGSTGAAGSAGTSGAAGTGAAGSGTAGTGSGTAGTGAAGTGAGGGAGHETAGAGGGAGHGTGAGGATAGTGGGAAGAGGGSGNKPCVDTACPGACSGTSCGGAWTCDTMVACSALATQYCGCDGKTFTGNSCPQRAYQHRGSCEAGVSCDTRKVLCKIATPLCPTGQVVSVNGTCYGPCVPVASCSCAAPAECPDPDTTTCHMNTMRCGPFVN